MADKTIPVTIEGKVYQTIVGEDGVQKFQENSLIKYMSDFGMIDLNHLHIAYERGSFPKEEFMELYRTGLFGRLLFRNI